MKKKPLSTDAKKIRLLALMYEKKEVFDLQSLEKLGSNAGIVLQTIREVLEELISDGLVHTDKVGTKNIYWALPSQTYRTLCSKLEEYKGLIEKVKCEKQELQNKITEALQDRKKTEERKKKLEILKDLKIKYKQVSEVVEKYTKNSSERLMELEKEALDFMNKANMWTDNIFITKSWMNKKFFVSTLEINKIFGIPEDLDHLP